MWCTPLSWEDRVPVVCSCQAGGARSTHLGFALCVACFFLFLVTFSLRSPLCQQTQRNSSFYLVFIISASVPCLTIVSSNALPEKMYSFTWYTIKSYSHMLAWPWVWAPVVRLLAVSLWTVAWILWVIIAHTKWLASQFTLYPSPRGEDQLCPGIIPEHSPSAWGRCRKIQSSESSSATEWFQG